MPENCAAIVIAAKHHELTKIKDTRGTTNTIGALRCKFQFRTDDWLHSAKTVMFCNGDARLHPEIIDNAISVPLDADDECPVPYEVLRDTQPYSVGVWGATDSGLRIVSNWLVFGAQTGCYTEGNAPEDPERTVYEEILLISKSATDVANDVAKRADDGEFDGKSAYELAQDEGFEGTLKEWMDSLVGASGKDGIDGAPGKDGADGKDGKDGAPGQNGIDGKDGETPRIGANGNWWIGATDTGVKAAGTDGKDGVNGKDGVDGEDGITPTIEISEDGYWVINDIKTEYKAVGEDGKDGVDGAPGKDGVTPTIEISADGYWIINGTKSEHKAVATDGKDGKDGSNGVDGYTPIKGVDYFDGKDGISASHIWDGTTLTITSASGTSSANLKGADGKDGVDGKDGYTPVKGVDYFDGAPGNDGKDGEDGADGIGIQTATVDANGNLVVTLTNGTVLDLGNVKGADGEDGKDGQDGSNGKDGQDGAPGKDGVAPTIEIREDGYWYIDGVNTNVKVQGSDGKSARIGEITLTANGWNGDASPYSQVISIDGVTENSQVDLTPSVQQLAIFYEKDLAFVTENEDGVVTVYAIGQKPMNDYTIQVTITEVDI